MKLIDYIKDTRGELKHVSWPTQSQIINYTVLIILISIFTSFFLGFFDFIFTTLLDTFVFSDSGGSSLQIVEEVLPQDGVSVEVLDSGMQADVMQIPNTEGTADPIQPISI